MLASTFNLLQSLNYTPYLFNKKQFKSEINSLCICALVALPLPQPCSLLVPPSIFSFLSFSLPPFPLSFSPLSPSLPYFPKSRSSLPHPSLLFPSFLFLFSFSCSFFSCSSSPSSSFYLTLLLFPLLHPSPSPAPSSLATPLFFLLLPPSPSLPFIIFFSFSCSFFSCYSPPSSFYLPFFSSFTLSFISSSFF